MTDCTIFLRDLRVLRGENWVAAAALCLCVKILQGADGSGRTDAIEPCRIIRPLRIAEIERTVGERDAR